MFKFTSLHLPQLQYPLTSLRCCLPRMYIWYLQILFDPPRHLLIPQGTYWYPRTPIDPPPSCINSPRPCSSCNSYPNQVILIPLESKKSDLQDGVICLSICWHLFVQMSYTSLNHKISWDQQFTELYIFMLIFPLPCYAYAVAFLDRCEPSNKTISKPISFIVAIRYSVNDFDRLYFHWIALVELGIH